MTKRLVRVIVESADVPDPFAAMLDDEFGGKLSRLVHTRDSYSTAMVAVAKEIRRLLEPAPGVIKKYNSKRSNAISKKTAYINGLQIDVSLIPSNIKAQYDVLAAKFQRYNVKYQAAEAAITAETSSTTSSGAGQMTNVPDRIPVGASLSLKCAYHKQDPSLAGQYAGDPGGYPFTPQMRTIFNQLVPILARNKIKLTALYACRVTGGYINFQVTTGSDGKFVWSKYDMGGGSGQNSVYIKGAKYNTNWFINLPEAKQDAMLQ